MLASTFLLAHWHDGDSHWWIVFPILWLLLFALLIVFLWRRGPRGRCFGGDPAKQILGERFARGEISADEYRSRLDQLT